MTTTAEEATTMVAMNFDDDNDAEQKDQKAAVEVEEKFVVDSETAAAAVAAATAFLTDHGEEVPLSVNYAWAHAVKRKFSALQEEEEEDDNTQQQHQGPPCSIFEPRPPQPLSASEISYMYDVPEKKQDDYTFEHVHTPNFTDQFIEGRFRLANSRNDPFRAHGDSLLYGHGGSVAYSATPPSKTAPVASAAAAVVTESAKATVPVQSALAEYGNLACLRAGTFTIPVTSIGSREWERAVTKCAVNYALRQGVEPSNTVELGKMLTEMLIHTFILHSIVIDDVMSTTANRIAIFGIIPVLLLLTVTEKKTHLAYGANFDPEKGDKKAARAHSDLKEILQERAQFGYALM